MENPTAEALKPMIMEIDEGTIYWCSCGKSRNQPFCDGSHAGTSFSPLEVLVERKRKFAMCLCKHTRNPPYCDGAHSKIDKE